MVQEFGDKKGVVGFLVTGVRYNAVHENEYMKTYALIEEMGKPLAFHAAYNWQNRYMEQMNRFISVHALGFPYYNILHMTNLVVNGIFERFPKLRTMWIEGGVAWVPFLMQRLDNEYMMRPSECPLLKRLPSEYMAEQYYATQPLETDQEPQAAGSDLRRDQRRDATCASRPITRTGTSTCRRRSTTFRSCPSRPSATSWAATRPKLFGLKPWQHDKDGKPVYAG